MTTSEETEERLCNILKIAARQLNIEDFTLNLNSDVQKGDGLLGEIYKTSITNNKNGDVVHLVIKAAPINELRRDQTCVKTAYKNEIYFYAEVLPMFKKLQDQYQVLDIFDSVPPYVTSIGDLGGELIVFKDITKFGYEMKEKDLVLDDEHATLIFRTYGHFHALSFCLRDQNPKEWGKLTQFSSEVVGLELIKKAGFLYSLSKIAEKALQALDPNIHQNVIDKFQKYVDDTRNEFINATKCDAKFSAILHGDCWSNNIMFKYQNSKLESLNLIDFQLLWVGSPICDLSYFFYCGGSDKLYKNLNKYLDVYYESFSNFTRKLGSNPEVIYPRKNLNNEWKTFSRFGMLWAILLTKSKLISKDDMIKVAEAFGGGDEIDNGSRMFVEVKCDDAVFNSRVRDILIHMYEIDAL